MKSATKKTSKKTESNKKKYEGKYLNERFATTLRTLLLNKEFSQNSLAQKLEVSRQTISLYANGNSLPDIEKLKKIIEFFKENGYDYSSDYWIGLLPESTPDLEVKDINKKYGLTEKTLKKLEEYKEDKKLIASVNFLLSQKSIIKNFSDYLIYSNIENILFEDKFLKDFVSYNFFMNINKNNYDKLSFYNLIELFPLLKEFVKEKIKDSFNRHEYDLLFDYINKLKDEEYEEIYSNTCDSYEEVKEIQKLEKEFEKELEEFCSSKENKRMLKQYEDYLNKKEGEKE